MALISVHLGGQKTLMGVSDEVCFGSNLVRVARVLCVSYDYFERGGFLVVFRDSVVGSTILLTVPMSLATIFYCYIRLSIFFSM